jgi:hypothetical protein
MLLYYYILYSYTIILLYYYTTILLYYYTTILLHYLYLHLLKYEAALERGEPFDAILSDYEMPIMNGPDSVKRYVVIYYTYLYL